MAPAANLTVIASQSKPRLPRPPGKLGKVGMSLWRDITGSYEFADRGSYEILFQACVAADRAAQLRDQIDKDGVTIQTHLGIKDHPGLKHELAARAFVVRTLGRLGLELEPILAVGRPPGR